MSDSNRSRTFALLLGLVAASLAHAAGTINNTAPDTATAGAATFSIRVAGSGFQLGSVVYWNSTALTTTGGGNGQSLSATVAASLVASAGPATITVLNPDSTRSNGTQFTVVATPPNPVLAELSTGFAFLSTQITIFGSQLEPGATAFWNGVNLGALSLNAVNSSGTGVAVYMANVPLSLYQTPGPAGVTVSNPGSGLSNFITFTVPAISTLTSLGPPSATLNGAGFTLTVNGSNFSPTDIIVTSLGGTVAPVATQFISTTQLQTSIPASSLTTAGTFPFWVVNNLVVQGSTSRAVTDFSSNNQLYLTVGPANSCTYSLSAASVIVGTAASTGSVRVLTQAGCAWTATSPSNSVTIAGGASGSGTGTVNFNVAASNIPQSVALTIAGQTFTINQVPGCLFGLTPSNAAFASAGASGSFALGISNSPCPWTATSNAPWLIINAGASGSGNGTINYTAAPNPAAAGRSGTIAAGGQIFTVVQSGNAPCTYSLLEGSAASGYAASSGATTVQAPAGCSWTASSNVQWLSLTGTAGGSGNGTVTYSIAANPATGARTGSLTIAGQTYAVTQSGTSSTLTCSATAPAPPSIAIEGRTEVLGDLQISCTGLTGATTADIELTLNTNVTNTFTAANTTDSVLLVNEANPRSGQISGYSTLRWPGVSIVADASGTATVRITNVKADASLLTAPSNLQSIAVTGQVNVESQTPVPVASALQTLANAGPGLAYPGAVELIAGNFTHYTVAFTEATPTAFHTATGTLPATRLRAIINDIPSNALAFAPVYPNEGPGQAQLYSADANGVGGAPVAGMPFNGTTYQQMTVTNGVGIATWVVQTAVPTQIETKTFIILLQGAQPVDANAVTITASLAPVSSVGVASATAPLPRYRDFTLAQKLVNLRVSTQVTKAAPGSPLKTPTTAGSNVTFTTVIVNDDTTQTATNVTVRDNVSAGGLIVSCNSSDGQSCGSGTLTTVVYASLPPGASQTVTAVVAPNAALGDGSVVDNDVGVASDDPPATVTGTQSGAATIVLNGQPVAVGGLPAAGSGTTQSFSIQFSHPDGYLSLGVVDVLINSVLDGRHACYLAYSVPAGTLYLVDDGGDAGGPFAGSIALGSTASIQNSQCTVSLTSAVGSGTILTLSVNITFAAGFGGNQILYVAAQDLVSHNTNWQTLGVWQVPFTAAQITVANGGTGRGAAPAGTSQQLTLTLTDNKGSGDLGIVDLLINNAINGAGACYVAYSAPTQTLFLVDDRGDAGGPFQSMTLNGGNGSVQNSQCAITAAGSSVVPGANSLTLTLNITFTSAFQGNRVMYAAARDKAEANSTGWQAVGTLIVQ